MYGNKQQNMYPNGRYALALPVPDGPRLPAPAAFPNGFNRSNHLDTQPCPSSIWHQPTMERHKNSAELNGNGQGMLMRKKQRANAPQENPTNLKLVMVGLGGVGKSSLTIQFVQQYFVTEYDPTISDSYTKSSFLDNSLYRIEVVDTAGQEEYSEMREEHLRSGDGFLLVFSVTSRQSLEYVLRLKQTIERIKDREHFPMLLVGNKCDLESHRQISREEALEQAAHLQIPYLESSAKFRKNVEQIFHTLIRQIRQFRYMERRCNGFLMVANGPNENQLMNWGTMAREEEGKRKKKAKGKTCRIQ